MYVLSILFLITGVLFSGTNDTTSTVTGGVNSIVGDITNMNTSKYLQQQAVAQAYKELTDLGVSPEKCGTWRQDRNAFDKWVDGAGGDDNAALPADNPGSCIYPTKGATRSKWDDFMNDSGRQSSIFTSCAGVGAVNSFKVLSGTLAKCKTLQNDSNKCVVSTCRKTIKAIKDAAKAVADSNCDKCHAYVQSGTSLLSLLGLGTDLALLTKQLFGKDKTDDKKTTLSCDEQCSKYTDPDQNKACKCAATQTLADGVTTQRCALETECSADTTCKGKRTTMEKAGYCTGTDCDDIEQSCACTEIAGVTGAAKNRWDPEKRVCVKDADGSGDKGLAYTADTPKYNTDTPTTDVAKTDAASPTGTGAAGAGAAAGATPSTQTAAKTAADNKDKAKFASLSKNATSQFANNAAQNAGGGEYNADAAAAGGDSAAAKKPEDIVEAKGPDIWKIVHDIYQTGIDANRFMDYKSAVVEDKSAVKKGKKKVKGKNA